MMSKSLGELFGIYISNEFDIDFDEFVEKYNKDIDYRNQVERMELKYEFRKIEKNHWYNYKRI